MTALNPHAVDIDTFFQDDLARARVCNSVTDAILEATGILPPHAVQPEDLLGLLGNIATFGGQS